MEIRELKKLIQRLGGMLVMDGDQPSFVMLSYDNYKAMEKEAEAEIVVKHNVGPEYENGLIAAVSEADEDKIRQLNEEVAILRQEIKQREMEEMLPTDEAVE